MKNIDKKELIKSQDTWINFDYCKNCKYSKQHHITLGIYELKCKLGFNKGRKINNCKHKQLSLLYKLFN
jgi:hypothetical protein